MATDVRFGAMRKGSEDAAGPARTLAIWPRASAIPAIVGRAFSVVLRRCRGLAAEERRRGLERAKRLRALTLNCISDTSPATTALTALRKLRR